MLLMSSSSLIHWSGLTAILRGVWWIVIGFLIAFDLPPLTADDYYRLLPALLLLLLIGLVGVHVRQAGRTGRLEWTGFVVALIGFVLLLIGNVMVFWFVSITGMFVLLLGSLILCLGCVLIGIAAIRAKVLPRWSRALPILIGFLTPAQYIATGIGTLVLGDEPGLVLWSLFGAAWVLLGYALWSDSRQLAGHPQPSSGQAPG
jgi:hypothetical protein